MTSMGNRTFHSEADLIAWLRRRTPRRVPDLLVGIGDDAALLKVPPGQELLLTTDMSIETVHFTTTSHPPRAVGHRALARSLSDVAAMGGTPRYALISLALSRATERAWLEDFFNGLFALARRFRVAVIGGDTAVGGGKISADVVAVGTVHRNQALRRSGAQPGDRIFVSGRLGMAALGLRLLLERRRIRKPLDRAALRAHLFPQPQCALGRFLAARRLASAMMDLSDGLSIDLRRLCDASRVGATLFGDRIPIPPLPHVEDALDLALHGGEDYQLLFTVPAAKCSKVPHHFGRVPLCCIGEIRSKRGMDLITSEGQALPVVNRGYDHFARISHL
ncbi:MAG TPA: thiamine-phosphate kinase [Terriglobia bacterium]|nr:thiamine-phosphate kinase [Terriglobia bacterium]